MRVPPRSLAAKCVPPAQVVTMHRWAVLRVLYVGRMNTLAKPLVPVPRVHKELLPLQDLLLVSVQRVTTRAVPAIALTALYVQLKHIHPKLAPLAAHLVRLALLLVEPAQPHATLANRVLTPKTLAQKLCAKRARLGAPRPARDLPRNRSVSIRVLTLQWVIFLRFLQSCSVWCIYLAAAL